MNSYSVVNSTLNEILGIIKPSPEDWVARFKFINEMREVVQSVESLRGANVEPFGSFVSNLFTKWGDLDISIELTASSCISCAGKKRKQSLLGDLQRALRQKAGLRRLQFIPDARVPILKLESSYSGISCDISIDNLEGHVKSKFLLWLNDIDGRFRDMVLLVKEWAKAHNINNSKGGSFNSFSLSLLVIFHFQTSVPPILPPLRDIYPGNMAGDLTGLRVDAEKGIAEICTSNIQRYKSDKFRKINRSSLADLFISFMAKFSDLDRKAAEVGICPFTGKWEKIESNMRWLPKTYTIFVEDPFEQPANTARSVSQKNLTRICQAFENSCHMLMMGNQNQYSILPILVGPQASRSILKYPVGQPSSNGNYNAVGYSSSNGTYSSEQNARTHRQMQKAVHLGNGQMQHQQRNSWNPPSKVQNQSSKMRVQNQAERVGPESKMRVQNQAERVEPESKKKVLNQAERVRPESHSNGSAGQNPVQQNQSQRQQQLWKPKSK